MGDLLEDAALVDRARRLKPLELPAHMRPLSPAGRELGDAIHSHRDHGRCSELAILRHLGNPDPYVRARALGTLAHAWSDPTIQQLAVEAQASRDDSAPERVPECLSRYWQPPTATALFELLEGLTRPGWTAEECQATYVLLREAAEASGRWSLRWPARFEEVEPSLLEEVLQDLWAEAAA